MPKTNMTPAEIEQYLNGFCGTETWTKHFTNMLLMTDGILAMRECCNAFWLTDVAASAQTRKLREQCGGFQVWTLKRNGNGCVIECRKDTGMPALYSQNLEYTDFPLDEFKFYIAETGGGHPPTMMLTSEY